MLSKRYLDLLLVIASAPLWVPLLVLIAVMVRVNLGCPVFFRQKRPGHREQIFEMIKFRTMQDLVDDSGRPRPDDERITRFGSWLRVSSLDELPELLNVLRGEMSLVGPRPLLVAYLERYSPEQRRRHEVPPGLTGWAQVNGRNSISWEDKFKLDLWYVEHRSLKLDVAILLKTIGQVVRRRGVSPAGRVTMPEFRGDESKP